ncbi:hypothetical protein [Sporomusa malonica]|uniref:Iron-only hydrogenase system regulator n=1 Tax=Sporomusa malonica TaxID=112901 RepID=A0A1W2DQ08_9FIRM|nr:hypothetical protein [Sporomusa malonica]SMC99102.1 hypothetical protein SAMN04488500_11717 [Sporomusa malonica]
MTNCSTIMAIIQDNRVETAIKVQDVLTKYGCHIRVRLGLHDAAVCGCTNSGIILLQLCGEEVPVNQIEQELKEIPDVKVKYMTLD